MAYIYIDESGDLGFSDKGSEYFIIACAKINDEETHKKFKRIPKEIRERSLHKKSKKQAEIKFSNSSPLIRERVLSRVAKLSVDIYSLIIEKRYTKKTLRDNLPILYNYLIKILLEGVFSRLNRHEKLVVCLDKSMSPSQRDNFETYVKTEFFHMFSDLPDLSIEHESSNHNECLQVVDFICGAFGYKYNTSKLKMDCNRYADIIKNNIKAEKNDLFKDKTNPAY